MANATKDMLRGDGSVQIHTWALTTADHTGTPLPMAEWNDRSISFSGTWGGATAVLEGSNDGVYYCTLRDPAGVALSFTADGLKQVMETVQYVRPRLSVVGTGATVSACLLIRRATPMRT